MQYKRINEEEREIISIRLNQNQSIRSIALELKRSPSSISHEIKRNQSKTGIGRFQQTKSPKRMQVPEERTKDD
ncbi:MAG: helix-turn-helix domain-containing protein [Chloroflexi bacterium]|jgi:IS30 family transposase|nr:helix-turn-helix domain-containing protein [Chloroflexota bacterium]